MSRYIFRQQITDPKLLKQIDVRNINLINQFLADKEIRCSLASVVNYKSDLQIFFTWNLLHNNNKFFIDIKKREIATFFSYGSRELKWKSARFTRARACLSSFSNFIERFYDDEYPAFKNFIGKVIDPMPHSFALEKSVLTEEQVMGLLNHLTEKKQYQQACWVALAISSGARSSELLRFTVDIIDENNTAFGGIFLETTKTIKTKGRTKTGKVIKKYIIKDIFLPYYNRWMEVRRVTLKDTGQQHNSLFIKQTGEPAKLDSVRCWLLGMSKYLQCPIYAHAFRHYATTYLIRLKFPPRLIQEIMGWDSTTMVEIYNDVDVKDQVWSELDNLRDHLLEKVYA